MDNRRIKIMDGKMVWILVLAIACMISSGTIFYLTNKIKKMGGWQ